MYLENLYRLRQSAFIQRPQLSYCMSDLFMTSLANSAINGNRQRS